MNFLFLESSRSWGGQEYRTCLEVNWLNSHGHRAWFGCDPQSDVFEKAQYLGTSVVEFRMTKRFDPVTSYRLWKFCRSNRIKLIKCFSSKDHWLALPLYWLGIPLTRARCITDRIGGGARAFVYRHGCAKIVADAPVIKQQLVRDAGIDPDKIEVIGSAVDLARFNPQRDRMKFRVELGIAAETPLIVNVGMLRPDKGQLTLLEAARIVFKQQPEARFVVVGEGTGARKGGRRIRNAIETTDLAGRVTLLGYRWDIPDILAASDLVVIASLRTEASPIVLREALATGRPVVATRVGDVDKYMRNGEHGFIVSPGVASEMAEAIVTLLHDRGLAAQCGRNAVHLARERFGFDQMMEHKLRVDIELVSNSETEAPVSEVAI